MSFGLYIVVICIYGCLHPNYVLCVGFEDIWWYLELIGGFGAQKKLKWSREDQVKIGGELKKGRAKERKCWRLQDFIKLSGMRSFTKMAISGAAFGVRRPTSTTFVGIFKGYNFVVYTKIKFQLERGQKYELRRRWRKFRAAFRLEINFFETKWMRRDMRWRGKSLLMKSRWSKSDFKLKSWRLGREDKRIKDFYYFP